MNAYELADKGFNSEELKRPELWNLCIEMSRMLRQQADEKMELTGKFVRLADENNRLKDRIAELEKDLKVQQILAFGYRDKVYDLQHKIDVWAINGMAIANTQTKPLSDEPSVKEITDLWLDVINNRPANDKRPIEWHFANALLAKVRGEK